MKIHAEEKDRASLPSLPLHLLIKTLEQLGMGDKSSLNIQGRENYASGTDDLLLDGIARNGIAVSLVSAAGLRFRGIVSSTEAQPRPRFYQLFNRTLQAVSSTISSEPLSADLAAVKTTLGPIRQARSMFGMRRLSKEERAMQVRERKDRRNAKRKKDTETKVVAKALKQCVRLIADTKGEIRALYRDSQRAQMELPAHILELIKEMLD